MRIRNLLLHGQDRPPDERVALRAGPLEMEFEPATAMLRRVRLGDREVLRGIYGAVRDPLWHTIGPEVRDVSVEAGDEHFRITFAAECRGGPGAFLWHGEVEGRPDGSVSYHFDGRALAGFPRARIGLCVLHPIRECAGRPCRVETTDGRAGPGLFPHAIAPHQPFTDLRAIAHEVAPGLWAEVRFDGDAFEMEDQRNWTDASFKTYSTPLALPFPVEVPAGATVRQRVFLGLRGPVPRETTRRRPPARPTIEHVAEGMPRPRIGLGLAADAPDPSPDEVTRLARARPDHLRVDLDLDDPAYLDAFERASGLATSLGAALEVALFAGDDPGPRLRVLSERLARGGPSVASWIVLPDRVGTTDESRFRLVRDALAALAPGARFGAGTNQYFTQLNRERTTARGADFVAFSLNPQVHAFDDLSLVETLDGQSEVVRAARDLFEGLPVAVTPVTLLPRFNPHAAGPPGPPPSDARQASLFAAAWTVGSLRRLAGAGAASLTYYETTGPRGIVAGPGVSPIYHVLADLASLPGGRLDAGRCSHPLEVESLAATDGDRQVILVANLTPRPQSVVPTIEGTGPSPVPWRVRSLDETTAERAMGDPDAFRADAGDELDAGVVELRPYAVARLERAAGGPRP